jgi:hypothetical protein
MYSALESAFSVVGHDNPLAAIELATDALQWDGTKWIIDTAGFDDGAGNKPPVPDTPDTTAPAPVIDPPGTIGTTADGRTAHVNDDGVWVHDDDGTPVPMGSP